MNIDGVCKGVGEGAGALLVEEDAGASACADAADVGVDATEAAIHGINVVR